MIVNGYEIKPRADLQGVVLQGADLEGAKINRKPFEKYVKNQAYVGKPEIVD